MTLPNAHFQPIAELPSGHGLTIWGYGTRRCLSEIDDPQTFQGHAQLIARGDLLLVNHTTARPRVSPTITKVLYLVDKDLEGRVALQELFRVTQPGAQDAAAQAPAAQAPAQTGAKPARNQKG